MRSRTSTVLLLVLGALLSSLAGIAHAGAFGVSPIRIELDRGSRTGLITVTNDDDRRLYFQLKLFEWTQNADGEDKYVESGDLVFFPQILTIEPKDKRLVRIGLKSPPAQGERAFRLFIEELPDPNEAQGSGAQIAVRLRFGVPIFVTGGKGEARPEIASAKPVKGALQVAIRNTGEREIRLEEVSAHAGERLIGQTAGWYVFPGATRAFSIPVAPADCPSSGAVEIRAVGEGKDIRTTVNASAVMCQS